MLALQKLHTFLFSRKRQPSHYLYIHIITCSINLVALKHRALVSNGEKYRSDQAFEVKVKPFINDMGASYRQHGSFNTSITKMPMTST